MEHAFGADEFSKSHAVQHQKRHGSINYIYATSVCRYVCTADVPLLCHPITNEHEKGTHHTNR